MINFKDEIAEKLKEIVEIDKKELLSYIEVPKDNKKWGLFFSVF